MISWKEVMYSNHKIWGWMADFSAAAKAAGYPYFCWNDRVYETKTCKFTGIFGSDIK